MQFFISNQVEIFFYACILGGGIGVIYDLFRILRIAIKPGTVSAFIEDIIFFVMLAVCTFFFLLKFTEGQVRFYVILGEGLGFLLYYFTIGSLIYKIAEIIISIIKKIVTAIFKPIFRFSSYFATKIRVLFRGITNKGKKFKKISKNT